MIKYLHENWRMKNVNEQGFMSAVVPGTVYSDLLRNHVIEDPYYRDNENKVLELSDEDYEYQTEFIVEAPLIHSEEVELVFEGLDTLADIYLNEKLLGSAKNMHRTWRFSVRSIIKEGMNQLRVIFHSPTKFIAERFKIEHAHGSKHSMEGFPSLRKAHCMFGWDWGIRLPDAGIFRDVYLQAFDKARIDSVHIMQKHELDKVTLSFAIESELTKHTKEDEIIYRITVLDPEGNVAATTDCTKDLVINHPKLWWPNGYGEQYLYVVRVEAICDDIVVDVWEKKIGLRTMTMATEADQYGNVFAHEVNGLKIFAMGADYIPEDALLPRITPVRTRKLLEDAVKANFNTIRVWGGGFYPSDAFYEICDELGLVVWQDLMFACAAYVLSEEFEENITREIIDNVKRIRHHACLGLWCGNNEMEIFACRRHWVSTYREVADYIKMYEYLFPKLLKRLDPQTFYWPSSPSSGGSFDRPDDDNRGDVHFWTVWHANAPFTEYRKHYFRYLSEFGFQSFPCYKTIESFTEKGDRNIFSYVMEKHQRNDAANGKIMNYLSQTYLCPTNFSTIVYASQLLAGDAIRMGVEHFRRNRGRCMGTVYWQLNDNWPVASWSSIDYFGRWKALHYYAKRFFAPIMISCQEEGLLTQDPNPNAQAYEVKKSMRLNVVNETRKDVPVTVRWALRHADASVIIKGMYEDTIPSLTAMWFEQVEFPEANLYENYISYELLVDGTIISSGTAMFAPPKHFKFRDPKLCVRVEGQEVIVSSKAFAKSVEILNEDESLRLSDNYFDMNAGEIRVKVISGSTDHLTVRSVYDIR